MKLAKKTALLLIFLSLIWFSLSITQHESFSFLIDFDTGCPHDSGTNLFKGEKYGWPFYFIYVGYIERCTTVKPLMPDIRIGFPVQVRKVNITEVMFQNSGIIIWGYWDNSKVENSFGLFQSGFRYDDVGQTFKVYFREIPDKNIRCLRLIKKVNP